MHITGARRARRPRRAGHPEGRQPVPRRLGVGRQHPLQGHEAAGLALRRHPQPDGGPLAGQDRARRDAARPVPPLQRRRPHHLRGRRDHPAAGGQRRPAGPDRRRQLRLHLRRPRRARAGCGPSTSRSWAAARSTTTAGWPRRSAPGCRGCPGCRRASPTGPPTRTPGSCTTSTRTGPRPTTSPTQMPEKLAQLKETVHHRGGQEQRLPDRRRPVDPDPAPRAADLDALPRVELHRRHHPDARVLRPGPRQPGQPGHHRRSTSPTTPAACSTRSAAPAAA